MVRTFFNKKKQNHYNVPYGMAQYIVEIKEVE